MPGIQRHFQGPMVRAVTMPTALGVPAMTLVPDRTVFKGGIAFRLQENIPADLLFRKILGVPVQGALSHVQ